MTTIHWDHPDVDALVVIYYEKGDRDNPPYAEVEMVLQPGRTPPKEITRLFNHDALLDDFWFHRPDLEAL
jgi:hypothetical protein